MVDILQFDRQKHSFNKGLSEDDAIKGCLFGAFIGDAIGSPLEFSKKSQISDERLERVMQFMEKGYHKNGAGQITDDSEMAMSLASGLIEGNSILDLRMIVKNYAQWMHSGPFDYGKTIANALISIQEKHPNADLAREYASKNNKESQSNGALMRITPLAVWARKLSVSEIELAVKEENLLTHSHPLVKYSSIAYVLAIQSLLDPKTLGDRDEAYNAARRWARTSDNQEFFKWFLDIEKGILPKADISEGHVKIAFSYAFDYLKKGYSYKEAMRRMLAEGGDTDTNSCIVGGLIGAAVGEYGIPHEYFTKVFFFDPVVNGGIQRPKCFMANTFYKEYLQPLIDAAPVKLVVKNGQNGNYVTDMDEGKCELMIKQT